MSIKVKNLYLHADGGYYCLLSDDAPLKEPTDVGIWHDGVIYIGTQDERMRSTTKRRWDERFTPVAEYTDNDPAVLAMIRRANPGDSDFDFVKTFEAWHESEMGVTGHMLELAVGAVIEKFSWLNEPPKLIDWDGTTVRKVSLTITTEDLQRVAQNYDIERVPEPHGFTFVVEKSEIIST